MTRKILEVIIRSVTTYLMLLVLGRIIGRKLLSRITFFDFIVGVTLGSIAVRIALGAQESPLLASVAAVVITILVVVTDFFDIKSINFRRLVDGEPITLISSGKLLDYNLRKVKISINMLMMQLREKDIFNIDDVELAVIENDGQLTVLPKADKKPVTREDLNISKNDTELIKDIIIDGKIMYNNLKSSDHDEKWVTQQLKAQHINDIDEVFYAGLNDGGVLYVSKRTKQ